MKENTTKNAGPAHGANILEGKIIALKPTITIEKLRRWTDAGFDVVKYEYGEKGIKRVWIYNKNFYKEGE